MVSHAYLESRWAPLEEAMALELDPAARKRRLIPVLRADCKAPLRIRPLVAVDLRRDGGERQWRRLLTAVDPTRPEEPGGLVQRFSLRLDEATGELSRPSWHAAGAAWLTTAYLALAAVVALVYLLLWEVPVLGKALALLLVASSHVFAGLGWREDRDLFRRLSHLLGRSRSVRGDPERSKPRRLSPRSGAPARRMTGFIDALAQTVGLEEGFARLLPVCFGDLPASRLPARLRMLVRLDLGHRDHISEDGYFVNFNLGRTKLNYRGEKVFARAVRNHCSSPTTSKRSKKCSCPNPCTIVC